MEELNYIDWIVLLGFSFLQLMKYLCVHFQDTTAQQKLKKLPNNTIKDLSILGMDHLTMNKLISCVSICIKVLVIIPRTLTDQTP